MRARDAAQHTVVFRMVPLPPPENDLALMSIVPKGGTVPRPVVLRLFKSETHSGVGPAHLSDILKWNSSHWLESVHWELAA